MSSNADPFLSRVHPLFWPVLWISLKWLEAWTRRESEQGRGNWLVTVRVTWYGRIHIVSHIAPAWNSDLKRHSAAVAAFLLEPPLVFPRAHGAVGDLVLSARAEAPRSISRSARLRTRLAGVRNDATGPP